MTDEDVSELDFSQAELESLEREGTPVLRFAISYMRVAVESEYIVRVIATPETTSLPGLPKYIIGAFVSGGRACPLLNAARWLDLDEGTPDEEFTVVVESDGRRVGILAREIGDIESMLFDTTVDAFGMLPGRVGEFATHTDWVPGGVVAVLNIPKLLNDMASFNSHLSSRNNL